MERRTHKATLPKVETFIYCISKVMAGLISYTLTNGK